MLYLNLDTLYFKSGRVYPMLGDLYLKSGGVYPTSCMLYRQLGGVYLSCDVLHCRFGGVYLMLGGVYSMCPSAPKGYLFKKSNGYEKHIQPVKINIPHLGKRISNYKNGN